MLSLPSNQALTTKKKKKKAEKRKQLTFRDLTTEKRAQKFHADDSIWVVLLIG